MVGGCFRQSFAVGRATVLSVGLFGHEVFHSSPWQWPTAAGFACCSRSWLQRIGKGQAHADHSSAGAGS